MFKKYALATTALTFFLLQPDPAAAGPLIGAIAGVFSAVVSGAGIVNAVVSLALAAATTLYSMATAPDAPPPVGVKIQADVGDDQPVSTTIGQYATRGKRKYIGTWGNYDGDTPNTYLTEVFELGSIPVSGLDVIWLDGEKCTILWNEPDAVFGRGYPLKEYRDSKGNVHDYCWVKFYNGSQTTADPFLLTTFKDDKKRPWDATMIGRGIPYAIMTYRWERDYFKGQPKVLFEPAPLPLYDIRKDSTNGGNGTHRWEDQSTHEPSYNLGVMTYNVLRGLRYKGEWFYGGQKVNALRLPSSNWVAACQEAGRLVERADKTTEPQWRGGYEITGDTPPLTVIEEFRKAQNGRLTDQGGVFKMKNGIFGGAVFGFSDADTLITEPSGFDPFPSVDLTINGVTGKYPNPEEAWVAKDAPVVRNDAFEALDGKRNLADISFGATSHNRQVQQLMRAILAEARRFRRHQLPMPPMAYVLEAGIDVVSWTSPHNGYVNKRFLVTERRGQMGMNQIVTLQEIDPTDYDWVRTMQEVVSSGWIGRIDVPTQPMTGWRARASTMVDDSGRNRRLAIVVSCASNLADVARVRVRVRHRASGAIVFDGDQQPYDQLTPIWPISGTWLLPRTEYEVEGKLIPFSARPTEPSAWISVTTEDVRFSIEDLHLQDVSRAVHTELIQMQDWVWRDDRIRELVDDRKTLARSVAEQDLANFADKQELRREAAARAGQMTASFEEKIAAATSATEALTQRVVTFEAAMEDKASASVVETTIARVSASEGNISTLSADMTTLATSLSDKIGSSVFSSFASEVSQIGDTIRLQGDIINEIDLELDDKASLDALLTLTGTVTQQGQQITSQGEAILGIRSNVGTAIAQSRLRLETVNASGNGYALAALQTRFGTADDYRSAGFFIKTYSDPNQLPEVIFNAGRVAFAIGNDETGEKIFAVDAGGLYIDAGYIRNITTDRITFLDGSVQTSALAQEAALSMPTFSASNSFFHTSGTSQIGFLPVAKQEVDGVRIGGDVRVRVTELNSGNAVDVTIELYWGSQFLGDAMMSFNEVTSVGKTILFGGTIVAGSGLQNLQLLIHADRPCKLQVGRRNMTAIVAKRSLPQSA